MLVKDLIAKLSTFPQDKPVVFTQQGIGSYVSGVREVYMEEDGEQWTFDESPIGCETIDVVAITA